MSSIRSSFATVSLVLSSICFVPVATAADPASDKKEQPKKIEKCEHGVAKNLCTRCNPKLAAVYKSKGDWCEEHKRAESQCALCNPALAKDGVKP